MRSGVAYAVDVAGEVKHLVREAPLVVIPSHELDKMIVERKACFCVEDRGVRVRPEIGGNDFLVNILQNSLHRAFGSCLHCGADLVVCGCLVETCSQVYDGDIAGRNTHGSAGEFAFQLGDDLADCFCSAGGGRDDVVVYGSAESPVLLAESVNYGLGSCGSMNCRHKAFNDTEIVVQDFCHGCEAVCGAGSVGNELHIGSVFLKVYAADKHRSVVFRGAGHDNDLGAAVNMGLCCFLCEECASAFENIVYTELTPGNEGRITVFFVCKDKNFLAVDNKIALFVICFDSAVESAVYSIVLDAVCEL